jgi:type IV pilus assembly protein PilO
MATFISGIAALPRIVTISDMKLEPADKAEKDGASSDRLKMSATAKTYRYLQEDEQ